MSVNNIYLPEAPRHVFLFINILMDRHACHAFFLVQQAAGLGFDVMEFWYGHCPYVQFIRCEQCFGSAAGVILKHAA
jgi:hypothetical protein